VYRARVALIIVISFADCQLRDTFGGGKISGQTAYTLSRIFEENESTKAEGIFKDKEVLLKIITILDTNNTRASDEQRLALIEQISTATNQQTAVSKADRISNEQIYLEIQKQFFEKFGVIIERKKGEFADGLHKGYIRQADIVERNLLFRVYLATLGSVNEAASKKAFIKAENPERIIQNDTTMRAVCFGLLCNKRLLQTFPGPRAERDRRLVGSIYALCQNIPEDQSTFAEVVSQRIRILRYEWEVVINSLVAETGNQFLKSVVDIHTGERITVLNASRMYRSGLFEKKLIQHFKNFDWDSRATGNESIGLAAAVVADSDLNELAVFDMPKE
jgi:hypothetical protein